MSYRPKAAAFLANIAYTDSGDVDQNARSTTDNRPSNIEAGIHTAYRSKIYLVAKIAPLAAILAVSHTDIADASNVISRAIERAQPCSGLKTTVNRVVTVTIGIDKFKSAELETLKVDVAGDKATIALVGSLACRTSDAAAIKGDASAKFSANADLNLATCVAEPVTVRILSTGGTFGAAIEALKGNIQKAVEKSIAEQAKALCQ